MTSLARFWRPSTLGVFTLASAIIAAPLSAAAGDSPSTVLPATGIGDSIRTQVASEALVLAAAPRAQQSQTGAKTDLGSSNFFKTPAGIVTLIAVGAGLAYALYSTSHDRVKSPGR